MGNPYADNDMEKPRPVVSPGQPGPLLYYVTAAKATKALFGPDTVDACTDWARREAASRSVPLDVRETATGSVFFGFDKKGKFA